MSPAPLPLLAVPNVSEGRNRAAIDAIAEAFTAAGSARLLDVHHDADHHRAVLTLAGRPGSLADALLSGAAEVLRRVDIGRDVLGGNGAVEGGDRAGADGSKDPERRRGQHPHVGAIDVAPVVYLDAGLRGAACVEALVAADLIGGELGVPVFLYGELAGGRTRAELRRGGIARLAERMRAGELSPDFGPPTIHPTAGATLVAARAPLVAFNLELAPPATVEDARAIASLIREDGVEGLSGVRAIGVALRRSPAVSGGRSKRDAGRVTGQVSMNVERPAELPLREVVAAVRRHAEIACAELVGLAPAAALEGFPEDVPLVGFDPARHVIEHALSALGDLGRP